MTITHLGVYEHTAEDEAARRRRLLRALRLYQAAETAMRRRTGTASTMGENELLALRFMIRARQEDHSVTPTDVAKYLGVSTASTTALVDRLEAMGHVVRTAHPTDRRSVLIHATAAADDSVRSTLGEMDEHMMSATSGVDPDQVDAITELLDRMTLAVDRVGAEGP